MRHACQAANTQILCSEELLQVRIEQAGTRSQAAFATVLVSHNLTRMPNLSRVDDRPEGFSQQYGLLCGYENLARDQTVCTTKRHERTHSESEVHDKVEDCLFWRRFAPERRASFTSL